MGERNLFGLVLLLIVLCQSRTVVGQLSAEHENGDIYTIILLEDLEKVINSCQEEIGIGSVLNHLSNSTWTLKGGGVNTTNGDSLYFTLDSGFKNKNNFYAWVSETRYYISEDSEYNLLDGAWVSEYRIRFQFSDEQNLNYILSDISQAQYKKINEQNWNAYTVVQTFQKGNLYYIQLTTVDTGKGKIYLYDLYNCFN